MNHDTDAVHVTKRLDLNGAAPCRRLPHAREVVFDPRVSRFPLDGIIHRRAVIKQGRILRQILTNIGS